MYNKFKVMKIKYNINFFFFKENIKTFKHFFHCFQKELIKINHRNHIITKIWKTSLLISGTYLADGWKFFFVSKLIAYLCARGVTGNREVERSLSDQQQVATYQ